MKIITTIGTSLVTNVINPLRNRCNLSDEEKFALEAFSKLQQKDYKEKEDYQKEYDFLKEFIMDRVEFSDKTSAEIKSLINIKKALKDEYLEVIPIATDTILSPLCSEILRELIEKNLQIDVNFTQLDIIKDLQVSDYKRYKKGLINLLNRLNLIANNGEYFGDIILNIAGGFKGVIPYMTIYGQVNKIPLYYIFEFTTALIKIPQIPLSIDEDIFERDWEKFWELDKKEILQKNELGFEFIKNYEELLDMEDDLVTFNALGKILWDKYRRDHCIFFTTNDIFEEIKKQPTIQKILKEKFQFNYESKTEQKSGHLVYDDGNNPYRIFYFVEDKDFYIYKTFEDHDKYEKYLENFKIDKDKFTQDAHLYKI